MKPSASSPQWSPKPRSAAGVASSAARPLLASDQGRTSRTCPRRNAAAASEDGPFLGAGSERGAWRGRQVSSGFHSAGLVKGEEELEEKCERTTTTTYILYTMINRHSSHEPRKRNCTFAYDMDHPRFTSFSDPTTMLFRMVRSFVSASDEASCWLFAKSQVCWPRWRTDVLWKELLPAVAYSSCSESMVFRVVENGEARLRALFRRAASSLLGQRFNHFNLQLSN